MGTLPSLVGLFCLVTLELSGGEFPPAITVGPYLLGLGPDQVTVCWRTAEPTTGTVESFVKAGDRREEKDVEPATLHRLTLRLLPPSTEIRYRISSGGEKAGFFRFTTAPEGAAAFRFAAYGDSGGGGNPAEHERIAKAILSHHPAFVVHGGDFVSQGDNGRSFPAEFFLPARLLLAECPLLAVPGDNDRKAMAAYAEHFNVPKNRPWFTWTYGNLQLFALDSNEPLVPGSPQGQWLADALAASRARWKVAVLHHPLFSSGLHGSQHGVRRAVMPLFLQYGVDLVLAGHDRMYERTYAIAAGPEPTANAFVEIITAGGGNRLYPIAPQPWSAHAERRFNFCVFEVDADELRGTAFSDTDEALDHFVLYRRHLGGNEGPEGEWVAEKTVLCDDAEFIANAQRLEKFWFPPLGAQPASKRFELHLVNPFDHELRGDITWETKNPAWTVEPAKQEVRLLPHSEMKLAITASYAPQPGGGPLPVPLATFSSGSLKTTAAGITVQGEAAEKGRR